MFSQLSNIMEEDHKSLASQFDSFFNNVLELLDTTTERGKFYTFRLGIFTFIMVKK